MGQPPATSQELLDRIDRAQLAEIITHSARIPAGAEVRCHLHRSILGSRGYNGLTCIISAQYEGRDGCCGWVEVLLKWSRTGSQDARWYPLLLAAGAPIPNLHGVLQLTDPPDAASAEVLVLEYLPHIGHQEQDRLALAEALARFHALPTSVIPGLPQLRIRDAVDGWSEVWNRIPAHAQRGDLGPELAASIANHREDWGKALAAMPVAAARADALTRGVIHRDVSTQNTGWRHDHRELLLFDLPQMAIGPLVQDAQALFPQDQPMDEAVAQRYLTVLRSHGGPAITIPALARELDAVRPLPPLNFLWWATARSLDGKVDFTDDIAEGKRWYRNTLLNTIERTIAALSRVADTA